MVPMLDDLSIYSPNRAGMRMIGWIRIVKKPGNAGLEIAEGFGGFPATPGSAPKRRGFRVSKVDLSNVRSFQVRGKTKETPSLKVGDRSDGWERLDT